MLNATLFTEFYFQTTLLQNTLYFYLRLGFVEEFEPRHEKTGFLGIETVRQKLPVKEIG